MEGSPRRVRWKGVPAQEGGFEQGLCPRFQFWKRFQHGFQQDLYHLHLLPFTIAFPLLGKC